MVEFVNISIKDIPSDNYYTSETIPCNRGHNSKRYKKDNSCVECRRLDKLKYRATEKAKEANRSHYKKNKDKILSNQKLWRYGISQNVYDKILLSQNYKCAICIKDLDFSNKSYVCIDHCHETKIVRGILCHNCNLGIGRFFDNILFLKNAIKYLERVKNDMAKST